MDRLKGIQNFVLLSLWICHRYSIPFNLPMKHGGGYLKKKILRNSYQNYIILCTLRNHLGVFILSSAYHFDIRMISVWYEEPMQNFYVPKFGMGSLHQTDIIMIRGDNMNTTRWFHHRVGYTKWYNSDMNCPSWPPASRIWFSYQNHTNVLRGTFDILRCRFISCVY